MIVVRLIGGLGNQMFQYAMARSLADISGTPVKLDISGYEQYTLRRFELGDFNIRAEIASKSDIDFFRVDLNRDALWQRVKRRLPFFTPKMVYNEKSFSYDSRLRNSVPPVYFDGYWQTEKYFEDNAAAIRNDFTLFARLDAANLEQLRHIEHSNAVSLHVRRGDYVNDPNTHECHGVCSTDYYRDAVACMADRVGPLQLFIFSDDHQWAKANLDFGYPATFVTVNSDKKGVFDMMLMRHCKHHIIANSSFSWWGAWLNPSPDKTVIAPRRWFNKMKQDTRDLLPSAWVVL